MTTTWWIPIEDFQPFEPVTICPAVGTGPGPGTRELAAYLAGTYGGRVLAMGKACGTTHEPDSPHQEGRAIDWQPPSTEAGDRAVDDLLRIDEEGNVRALFRRMGIRVIQWQDRRFVNGDPEEPTDRHYPYVFIGLSQAGNEGTTSWYRQRASEPESAGAGVFVVLAGLAVLAWRALRNNGDTNGGKL